MGDDFEQAAEEARAIAGDAGKVLPEKETVAGPGAPPPAELSEQAKLTASLFVAEMVPFGVLAQFRGLHWRATKEEVEQLAPLWAEVLDKYYPDWWKATGPEVRLLFVLGSTCYVKYQIEQTLLAKKPKPAPVGTSPAASVSEPGAEPGEWQGGPRAKV